MAGIHAPKTGPGFSAGKASVKVSHSGDNAKAKNSQGLGKVQHVHPDSKPASKAGDSNMMRKPYK